jgi:hypothetical protein
LREMENWTEAPGSVLGLHLWGSLGAGSLDLNPLVVAPGFGGPGGIRRSPEDERRRTVPCDCAQPAVAFHSAVCRLYIQMDCFPDSRRPEWERARPHPRNGALSARRPRNGTNGQ